MPGFLERNKKHTEFVYFFRFGVRESEIYFAVFRFVLCLWSVSGCVRASPLSDKQICSTFHNLYVVHFFFSALLFFRFRSVGGSLVRSTLHFFLSVIWNRLVSLHTINTCQ